MAQRTKGAGLTGSYRVRTLSSALQAARRLFPKAGDVMELRSQALKLRYWPQRNPTDDSGQLLDLNWAWIKSLSGLNVGELRIGDTIGGHDNLRVIFFVAEKRAADPMPIIWILHVMQKKRQGFTTADAVIFKARRKLVGALFYPKK
jgi:hypothetical protein